LHGFVDEEAFPTLNLGKTCREDMFVAMFFPDQSCELVAIEVALEEAHWIFDGSPGSGTSVLWDCDPGGWASVVSSEERRDCSKLNLGVRSPSVGVFAIVAWEAGDGVQEFGGGHDL